MKKLIRYHMAKQYARSKSMNYGIRPCIILCLIMVMSITGCGQESTSSIVKTPKEYQTSASPHHIHTKGPDTVDTHMAEYNLADLTYTTAAGNEMPFKLRGVIAVPEGKGKFPLVLIAHGSHSNEDETARFDTGFSYLAEKLAKNGYIALSMDMSSAYLWKYGDSDDKEKALHIANMQIQYLQTANEGTDVGYPVDLEERIDFSKVALCGFSRGGDTIFDIALDQKEKALSVGALLSIAPTLSADAGTREWPDTNVSILVPEYDGDVVDLDGIAIHTLLEQKINSMHTLTMLRKANHNYFNTGITANDATLFRTPEQLKDELSPKEQQTFLSHFSVDFFNAALKGRTEETIYTGRTPAPDSMYGCDVMCRLGNKVNLFCADMEMDSRIRADSCEIKNVKDSWFFKEDETLINTLTFGNDTYKSRNLLQISWERSGAKLIIWPSANDFRKHSVLSLRLVTDPSHAFNKDFDSQRFTVILKDGTGNTSAVTLPDGLNSLSKTPGMIEKTIIEEKEYPFWSFPSPIFSTDIPLSQFQGVELTDINSVELHFDQASKGGVYLEQILLF